MPYSSLSLSKKEKKGKTDKILVDWLEESEQEPWRGIFERMLNVGVSWGQSQGKSLCDGGHYWDLCP